LLDNLVEIDHNGFHRASLKSREIFIDKVFVTSNLLECDIQTIILESCENKGNTSLGHKTIVLALNEKIIVKQKEITSHNAFLLHVRDFFNDSNTHKMIRNVKCKYSDHEIKNLISKFDKIAKLSKKKIKLNKALVLEDLEDLAYEKSSESVKSFCLFYQNLKNKLLTENGDLELITKRPPLKDLSLVYETKLNNVSEVKFEIVNDFINKFTVSSIGKIKIPEITKENFDKIIKKINTTTTPWFGEWSPKLLIKSINESNNLRNLIFECYKKSLRNGYLDLELTMDRVFFLHKKKDRLDPRNYRGITISCPVTKIFEQLFKDTILSKCQKFIDPRNYAYTHDKSTISAILDLFLEVEENVKSGESVAILLTDFSSAFESIQGVLISEIVASVFEVGVYKVSDWIKNFNSKKRIVVTDGNEKLEINRLSGRVGYPQGSIISPMAWLFQTSLTYYQYDKHVHTIYQNDSNLTNVSLRGFADDSLHKLSFKFGKNTSDDCKLKSINKSLDKTLEVYSKAIHVTGGIINVDKTEKLFWIEDAVSGLKKSTVWLGISIEMTQFGLEANVVKTLKDIRIKTMPGFIHICTISSDVLLRRKIFQIYIEPIIEYHLVTLFMTKKYKKTLDEFKKLQNNFLRKIAKVGYYAGINELHEMLGFMTIEEKLNRLAANLWPRLKSTKTYKTKIVKIHTRNGEKQSIKIKTTADKIFSRVLIHQSDKTKKRSFNLEEFKIWQSKMWKRGMEMAKKTN